MSLILDHEEIDSIIAHHRKEMASGGIEDARRRQQRIEELQTLQERAPFSRKDIQDIIWYHQEMITDGYGDTEHRRERVIMWKHKLKQM